MVKRNKRTTKKDNELYILPSSNEDMRAFVAKFQVDMMEHIISSIKFAVENNLSVVEVFQFKNSPFVVTIAEQEFDLNLEYITNFYQGNQMYELCPKVEQLRKILKRKSDEKEKPEADNNGSQPPE